MAFIRNLSIRQLATLAVTFSLFITMCTGCSKRVTKATQATKTIESSKKPILTMAKSDNARTSSTENSSEESTSIKATQTLSNNAKAAALYKQVLDSAKTCKFGTHRDSEEAPGTKITFLYALVNMSDRDIPDLILVRDNHYLQALKFFTVNANYTDTVCSEKIIELGVAAAGGCRSGLLQAEKGNCLYHDWWLSGSGQGETIKLTMHPTESDPLKQEKVWSGIINQAPKLEGTAIEFLDITDTKALSDLANQEDGHYKQ